MTVDDAHVDNVSLFATRLASVDLVPDAVPALSASFARSAELIGRARQLIHELSADAETNVDVVGFGSLARHEFTPESDSDYLVVAYALDPHPGTARRMLQHADALRTRLISGVELRPPGSTGVFGRVTSAADMVERIGLEEDTNHSHTRRILLLQESVSLYRPDRHSELLASIIDRYLFGRVVGRDSVPRFLLNDIIRYWRTITVDYQAKSFGGGLYSLRYLKLLISRKLAFAASIAPLVQCAELDHAGVGDHLLGAYQEPALCRLLRVAPILNEAASREALRDCILAADRFTEKLSQAEWRERVAKECRLPDPTGAAEFGRVRQWGKELQDQLQKIFFDRGLRDFTEKYMIF